jgi:hypothetical protein
MGVVTNGIKGASFDTIEDGVTAQLQHLFAYGCKEALPTNEAILDPRFTLVTRGVATYWQQLAGRWACPGYDTTKYATPADAMAAGNTYGQKIRNIYDRLVATEVTEADVNEYFKKDTAEEPTTPEEVTPEDITSDSSEQVINLATLIFNVLKKLIQMFADLFSKK